jgi:hypothetical protein
MEITVRHAEPDDTEAIHRLLSDPRSIETFLPARMLPERVGR